MKEKCNKCQKCRCQDEHPTYWRDKYEQEYLFGMDKYYLNQNGELFVKNEGGIHVKEEEFGDWLETNIPNTWEDDE